MISLKLVVSLRKSLRSFMLSSCCYSSSFLVFSSSLSSAARRLSKVTCISLLSLQFLQPSLFMPSLFEISINFVNGKHLKSSSRPKPNQNRQLQQNIYIFGNTVYRNPKRTSKHFGNIFGPSNLSQTDVVLCDDCWHPSNYFVLHSWLLQHQQVVRRACCFLYCSLHLDSRAEFFNYMALESFLRHRGRVILLVNERGQLLDCSFVASYCSYGSQRPRIFATRQKRSQYGLNNL